MDPELPLLIEIGELEPHLDDENVVVVDVSIPSVHKSGHIPGAIHLKIPTILSVHDDVDCDLPCDEDLSEALSKIGLLPEHHVVAYDAQYNPLACRLLWTLEELGHQNYSLVNGGWHAWRDSGLPTEIQINILPESSYSAKQKGIVNAKREYIESKLNNPDVVILDTRMHEEFTNELIITDRGGKIPGAINFDWMNTIDKNDCYRYLNDDTLRDNLSKMGIIPEKEIIIYCQTHMRSAHTHFMLQHLGFKNIKSYAAGYSEWGNATDTIIENELSDEDKIIG